MHVVGFFSAVIGHFSALMDCHVVFSILIDIGVVVGTVPSAVVLQWVMTLCIGDFYPSVPDFEHAKFSEKLPGPVINAFINLMIIVTNASHHGQYLEITGFKQSRLLCMCSCSLVIFLVESYSH